MSDNAAMQTGTMQTGKRMLTVTQVRSGLGRKKDQIQTLVGLGLGKVRRSRELEDTAAVRGMINRVKHLVEVRYEADGESRAAGEGAP